jgi:hypothetical protein
MSDTLQSPAPVVGQARALSHGVHHNAMRSETEIREQLAKFKAQARSYKRSKDGLEAYACSLVCSVLAYTLGEASSPTISFRLDP